MRWREVVDQTPAIAVTAENRAMITAARKEMDPGFPNAIRSIQNAARRTANRNRKSGISQESRQGLAGDVLHDDRVAVAVRDKIVDPDDGRVVQTRRRLGLAAEALGGARRGPGMPADAFHRHLAIQTLVESEEDFPHAATPKAALQSVRSDTVAGEIPVAHT